MKLLSRLYGNEGSSMNAGKDEPYLDLENTPTVLPTEPDRFLERRPRLRAARVRVNHFHGRYWQAIQRAFGLGLARTVRHNAIMKFIDSRPFADPEAAAKKLIEIANGIEPVQDGRIFIELINWPFLHDLKGSPAEYKAGLDLAIARGWLWKHESGTYVKLTQKAADGRMIDDRLRSAVKIADAAARTIPTLACESAAASAPGPLQSPPTGFSCRGYLVGPKISQRSRTS
jgi:hypothetical protein